MTRDQWAAEHLDELGELLKATFRDWHEGKPIRLHVTEWHFNDYDSKKRKVPTWWKRYCAEQYNQFVQKMGVGLDGTDHYKHLPMDGEYYYPNGVPFEVESLEDKERAIKLQEEIRCAKRN